MGIDFQIAIATKIQVHHRVFSQQSQHVIEERDARPDRGFPRTIQIQLYGHPRFFGFASDLGAPAFHGSIKAKPETKTKPKLWRALRSRKWVSLHKTFLVPIRIRWQGGACG